MIIVFGSINLDLVARVPRIPAPGETLAGSAFVTAPGGKGANQALAARDAGAEVALYGAVGRDDFARAALVNLVAAGVDLTGVARVDAPTGVALINVDARGENAITVVAGANAHARADQVADATLGPGHTLLMQLETSIDEVTALAVRAHKSGARVVLNAAPASPLPDNLLRSVDVLVVNEHEAAVCAGTLAIAPDPATFAALSELPSALHASGLIRACERPCALMRERFGVAVVLTLGARGALAFADGQPLHVQPSPIAVVDTTGAGDALTGGLAAALDAGASLDNALAAGVRAGAQACSYAGAQRAR